MKESTIWATCLSIIVAFVIVSELVIVARTSFLSQSGLDWSLILLLLWSFPVLASFTIAYKCREKKVLKILSLRGT